MSGELSRSILAIVAVVILALALSATKNGATLVQGGLVVAIVAVVLKNQNAVEDAARNLAGMVAAAPRTQSSA